MHRVHYVEEGIMAGSLQNDGALGVPFTVDPLPADSPFTVSIKSDKVTGKAVQVDHIRLTLGVESAWLSTS